MGLPWIAVQKSVVDHPKVIELGESLGEPLALAYLVTLWCRVAEYAPSGRVSGARPRTVLERFANWRGEPGKFSEATIAVGLVEERDGTLIIHDWDELQGPHIERSNQDADRKRKYRATLKKDKRPRTICGRSADGPDDSPGDSPQKIRGTAHVEERRGEETIKEASAPAPARESLDDGKDQVLDQVQKSEEAPAIKQAPPSEPASKGPSPEMLRELWNARAGSALPRCNTLTSERRKHARARLLERPLDGPDGWGAVIERLSASSFCRGEAPGHDWRASFDWLLRPDTAVKVLEGKYDDPPEKRTSGCGPPRQASLPAASPSKPARQVPLEEMLRQSGATEQEIADAVAQQTKWKTQQSQGVDRVIQ